jgi:aromatic-L-amino-acid/L-tryptophan decarboxylase
MDFAPLFETFDPRTDQYDGVEETLDPTDWSELCAIGHRMVDDLFAHLQDIRQRPVWQPLPETTKAHFRQPLPQAPQGLTQAYDDFRTHVLPYPMGNLHPRFWGWVIGSGSPVGMLAELLAAGLNPNVGGAEQAASYVEEQVLAWCKELLGYPASASGLLVSGGSMANFTGLAVALNSKAGFDVRRRGVRAAARPLVLYASSETHSSVRKAVELLGLGHEALRLIPVQSDYTIDLDELAAAIAADRAVGKQPFCVVGNAGAVNTGAVDDLAALADLCAREGLWLHVDGAFGAVAALSPALRPQLAGMERADSLAFDLHKWLHIPYEAGCILVRNGEAHRRTFSLTPDYLAHHGERGLSGGEHWFHEYGLQLSRGFRALKIWLALKSYGVDHHRRLIEQNVAQAHYLAAQIDATPELVRMAPVALQIVCFRYQSKALPLPLQDRVNEEILLRLQEEGIAVLTSTLLDGRLVLRCSITNHRTRREDLDLLVESVVRMGRRYQEQLLDELDYWMER